MRHHSLRLILSVILLCAATALAGVSAQDAITHYYSFPSLYNPGAAGATGKLDIKAGSRFNGTASDPDGKLMALAASAPFTISGHTFGAGITASRDDSHPFRTLRAGIQGSFSHTVFGGRLWGGIGIAYLRENYDYTVPSVESPETTPDSEGSAMRPSTVYTGLKGSAVDIGTGIFYSHPWFWGGISVLHANAPEINFGSLQSATPPESDDSDIPSDVTSGNNADSSAGTVRPEDITHRIPRALFVMAGSNLRLGRSFEVLPSAMLRTAGGSTRVDLTGRVRFRGLIAIGASWRNAERLSALASIEHKGFFIGYAYGYPLSAAMRALTNGSHEIVAGYSVTLSAPKKPATRHKSIRIM